MAALVNFLKSCCVPKHSVYNVVGMGPNAGRYRIEAGQAPEFWQVLEYSINTSKTGVSLAEVVALDQSTPRIDLDLFAPETNPQEPPHVYSDEDVAKVVSESNHLLRQYVAGVEEADLVAIILEKNSKRVIKDGNVMWKRGVHIQWPRFVIDMETHKRWLSDLSTLVTGVDPLSCTVPWLMYGCCKPNSEPYKISYALGADGVKCMDYRLAFANLELNDESTGNLVDNPPLAQYMSIRPYGRKYLRMDKVKANEVNETSKIEQLPPLIVCDDRSIEEICTELREYLGLLSLDRCRDYAKWLEVGQAIFSITGGSDAGLETWCDWSMEIPEKFSYTVCQSKWSSFCPKNITCGLIKYWAKQDSPDAYEEYRVRKMNEFRDSLQAKPSYGEVARFAKVHFGDKFIFSDQTWYTYENHKWNKSRDSTRIKISLNEELRLLFEAKSPVYRILDEPGKIKNVIEMMELCYYKPNFADKLDANPWIIGFKNGVYNLDTHEFRDGVEEDYISKTLECDYIEYTNDSVEVLAVQKHMNRFFPDMYARNYFLDIMSNVFVGNLYLKNLFFWVGTGDNGKTALARWFESLLGIQYCVNLPTTLLSASRAEPGRAAPELCQLRGKRCAFFNEPSNGEKLDSGPAKVLSGRDTIHPRELYQKGEDSKPFSPMCLYIFVCNKEPGVKNEEDKALWNRFRVIEFKSKFVDPADAPATEEEQDLQCIYPSNANFAAESAQLCSALAWCLLERWKRVKGKTIITPQCISKATQDYKSSAMTLVVFVRDHMIKQEGNIISLQVFKDKFNNFLASKSFNMKAWSNKKYIEELQLLEVDASMNGIIGYNFC